jgi:tetratricopeptide (TPR) repeat protein
MLEQAVRYARDSRSERDAVLALGNLALVEKALGDYTAARTLLIDVLDRQRRLQDWIGVATRLNDLAALHQAQLQWDAAQAWLREGLDVCDRHGIAFVRPHLRVNLALVCFYRGEIDEGERVAEQALAEARADTNRNVESTALLVLVRLASRRGACAKARERLAEAIACSRAMHAIGAELDCVFCHAEILAVEGETAAARAWMRYYIAHPDVERGDREVAQAALAALPATRDERPLPELPLDALLDRILQQPASIAGATTPLAASSAR